MHTLDIVLVAALAVTNGVWAFAYRRLSHKSLEFLGALWASRLDRW